MLVNNIVVDYIALPADRRTLRTLGGAAGVSDRWREDLDGPSPQA